MHTSQYQHLDDRLHRTLWCVVALASGWAGSLAWAQTPPAASTATQLTAASAVQISASVPVMSVLSVGTDWGDLTQVQQRALRPLETSWASIDEAQRRKWLALSRNYTSLSADGQAKLHSRMRQWAALSPKERIQARLNFAETKGVPVGERRAKWEEYQALSPEEKRKLAASAPTRPHGAALAIKPNSQKLVTPRHAASAVHPASSSVMGSIFIPDRVNPKTLLPKPEFRSQP